ncbi:ADP-ribosylglycohydrolase family protein [Flavivirga eckloniae]|nr:ADP-ribosylglycohydrolase family protein [Flavivirga eckloniae]
MSPSITEKKDLDKIKSSDAFKYYKDRAAGCYFGAAIADAMGGPPEFIHYKRRERDFGWVKGFLEYKTPPGHGTIGPGYALHTRAGSITDDTFIRADCTRFYLNVKPPYTAHKMAHYFLKNADFSNWWTVAVKALRRVESGEVSAEDAGFKHQQGGGGAWWQPVSILNAGDPLAASNEVSNLCRIWKAPLERDILSSVVAGQAAAYKKGSTVDSVINAVLDDSGPLAKKLFERALDIAKKANSPQELYKNLYAKAMVDEVSTEIDGPMPKPMKDVYVEGGYGGVKFAEQQPWALAYFLYGNGDPEKTVLTAINGGRDSDSIASNAASWLGALYGESIWPKEWVDTVQEANLIEMDIRGLLDQLVDLGVRNGTVAIINNYDI